jgi:hypothetical protein
VAIIPPTPPNSNIVQNVDGPVLIINFGTVSADDQSADFDNTGDSSQVWTDYVIHSRYEKDLHRYMLPVSSPGGFQGASVAFVQLAAPTILWVIDFTAARASVQPNIPDPDPGSNSAWVLLDEHVEPSMIEVTPDAQTPVYRFSGTYIYGHRNPDTVALVNNVNYTRPPWLLDIFDRTQPIGTLKPDLTTYSKVPNTSTSAQAGLNRAR